MFAAHDQHLDRPAHVHGHHVIGSRQPMGCQFDADTRGDNPDPMPETFFNP